jgi:hypothetical protein
MGPTYRQSLFEPSATVTSRSSSVSSFSCRATCSGTQRSIDPVSTSASKRHYLDLAGVPDLAEELGINLRESTQDFPTGPAIRGKGRSFSDNTLHEVPAAVDMNHLARDVIVFDQKHDGVNDVLRRPGALEERAADGDLLLLFRIVVRK